MIMTWDVLDGCYNNGIAGIGAGYTYCWLENPNGASCVMTFYYCRIPPTPTLSSPQTNITIANEANIQFQWSDVSYTLPNCNASFTSFYYVFYLYAINGTRIQSANVSATTYFLPSANLPGGSYYWTVENVLIVPAASSLGSTTIITPTASVFYFKYCALDISPSVPTLLTPTNSQNFSSSVSPYTISLSWSLSTFGRVCTGGTNTFTIYWSQSSTLATNVSSAIVLGTSSSYSNSFTQGTWYWMVTASNGGYSTNSAVNSFLYMPFNSTCSIHLTHTNKWGNRVVFDNFTFGWNPSNTTAACASSTITYGCYISLGSVFFLNYTGTDLSYMASIPKGSYQWYVTATDSQGSVTQSPTWSFVTNSSCKDVTPSAPAPLSPLSKHLITGKFILGTI